MKPDRGFWSVLCLILLAVLAPTACILYFMNEALNNQQAVAHQKLSEAYRGQLRMVQQKLDAFWAGRAAALDSYPSDSPSELFARLVSSHVADSIICLGADGKPAYPTLPASPAHDPAAARPDWQAARALETMRRLQEAAWAYKQIADGERNADLAARARQAQIRCLAQRGRPGTFELLKRFEDPRFATSRDLEGRLIAADELLLEVRLRPRDDPARLVAAERLHNFVADYRTVPMPSGQRLFLMQELRDLALGSHTADFPTFEAEQLAAQYFEGGRIHSGDSALRLSDVSGVWRIGSPGGRVIALYREANVNSSMAVVLQQAMESLSFNTDLTIGFASPGTSGLHDLAMPGGAHMPGWQVNVDVKDSSESAGIAARRRASYIWLGFLVIAVLTVTALLAGRAFLRQLRLARLKTDLVATVSHELKTPLAGMQVLVDTLLDAPNDDTARTREYLEMIARENARLSRLIANFLTFSRMERNRAQFEFARVEPAAVLRAAVESVGDRFAVEHSAASGLPALYADEDALVTVLLNLLDNA